jgi:hypothetical protein
MDEAFVGSACPAARLIVTVGEVVSSSTVMTRSLPAFTDSVPM